MDYEKKYKELVGKIEKAYLFAQTDSTKAVLEEIRPELAESEDERIRKEILDCFKAMKQQGCFPSKHKEQYDSWIAWLEKQGGHANFRNKIQIGDKVTRNKDGVLVNLSQLKRVAKKDEKQGERRPANKVASNLLTHERAMEISPFMRSGFENEDKVEPKFHEGEWVVYECGEETATLQITRIVGETYVFSDDSTLSVADENTLRLWDITKDAKDGDVLEFGDHGRLVVGIVNYINKTTGKVDVNCLLENNGFKVGNYYNLDTINPHPATKEQRDTLKKAMANAGYRWDKEKT